MSYNGTGTFNINTAGQPVVTGTTITSTAFNLLTADLASGLTTALTKDGQTTPTANIPMGTFKITGLGAGSAATDAAQYGQLQNGATTIATVSGTDTLTGTLAPAITAYATGNLFSFVAVATNTGAATINLNSLGAKSITKSGTTALVAGDLVSGQVYLIEYDGTRFQLVNPSVVAAGGVAYTAVKTANYTAVNNDGVLTNTTGGSFTVTLPTSPSVGNIVVVVDSFSQWGTNNLIIDPTALIKIAGNTAGDTLTCDITGITVTLVYTGATYGWNVAAQVGGNGGTAVTLTGTQTLTNKTIAYGSNTLTDVVGVTATQTLTNKTLTAPTIASANLTTALTLAGAAGTNGQVLTSAGSGLPTWATVSAGFTLGTPVASTSGTSIDFTGIPSGTKQIVITFINVSTNGTSNLRLQLGDSGGVETADYNSLTAKVASSTSVDGGAALAGFLLTTPGLTASANISGVITLVLQNSSLFRFGVTSMLNNQTTGTDIHISTGFKALSAQLDRVRITTENGTDAFDAGQINIAYI